LDLPPAFYGFTGDIFGCQCGTTTIVAWNIGAGNTKKANEVARQSIILNFIMGIIISTIGVFMAHDIVVFMEPKRIL